MSIDFTAATQTLQEITKTFSGRLPYLLIGFLVFVVFYWISRRLRRATARILLARSQNNPNLAILLARIISSIFVGIGVFVGLAFAVPDFTPSTLVSLFGFVSVAVGLAFRDILANILAGIFILYTEPFKIGDSIVSGTAEGTVEEIQTRATILKSADAKRIVIPNSQIYNASVTVNTAFPTRRVEAEIRLAASADPNRAREIALEALQGVEGLQTAPAPDFLVTEIGNNMTKTLLRFWINADKTDVLNAKNAALIEVKAAFASGEIALADL